MHAFSFCALPAEIVTELNCEYLFELDPDAESNEFKDNAVTEAAFPRESSGKGPKVKKENLNHFFNQLKVKI